jgi:hypothetical protein
MDNKHSRGLVIHFTDGSKINVSFPQQTDDAYRRKVGIEEIMKRRTIIVEADGAMHVIPFENVKYMTIYPAPELADPSVIKGATFND